MKGKVQFLLVGFVGVMALLLAGPVDAKPRRIPPSARPSPAPTVSERLDDALLEIELPRRLAPMPKLTEEEEAVYPPAYPSPPLSTECSALYENVQAQKGKPKPLPRLLNYVIAHDRVTAAVLRGTIRRMETATRIKKKKGTLQMVISTQKPGGCVELPPIDLGSFFGGVKSSKEGFQRATSQAATFLAGLVGEVKENDEGFLRIGEREPSALKEVIGPWRVTEAFSPTSAHDNACHYLGCALDIALCADESCKTAAKRGTPETTARVRAFWKLLGFLYGANGSASRTDICFAKNEYVSGSAKKTGPHFHVEIYTCTTDFAMPSKGTKVYDMVTGNRVKELEVP